MMIIEIFKNEDKILVNKEIYTADHLVLEGITFPVSGHIISKETINRFDGDIQRIIKGKYIAFYQEKNKKKIFLINDWLSKMPIYYYNSESLFIASNNFLDVVALCKKRGVKLTPSLYGLYFALTMSGMCGDYTHFEEIKYLNRFCRIEFDDKYNLTIKTKNPTNINYHSRDSIIEKLGELFNNALIAYHQYNLNNHYDDFFTISGGMDSRMVLLNSLKLGIKPKKCLSYSIGGSIDDVVSSKICNDNKLDLYFIDITKGLFLNNFDKAISMNGGQQIYCGSTGAILLNLNHSEWLCDNKGSPIIFCGLLGGELLAFEKTDKRPQYPYISNYSFFDNIVNCLNSQKLKSRDVFIENNTRLCQNLMFQLADCGTVLSPFMDEDFYECTLSIKPSLLKGRKLYKQWMNKTVPNNYVTTYDKSKIKDNKVTIFINRLKDKIMRKIKGKTIFDMVSFDEWLKDKDTGNVINALYENLISNVGDCLPILSEDFKKIYSSVDSKTKLSLLTYLGVINYEKMCFIH